MELRVHHRRRMPALRLTLLLVLAAVATGCSPFRSAITTGPDGLRTFTPLAEVNGQRILCNASAAIDPVVGTLRGGVGAQEPAWLLTQDGTKLSIVWPAGFLVKFEPAAALYNDRGERVAVDGDEVALRQVSRTSRVGSYADPFIASGLVYNGCYNFVP
jgi:hypothetical protein